ncbi:MAG: double zinc ribbon domain-containing protein, partial [Alphaproteobacteria bacterium]
MQTLRKKALAVAGRAVDGILPPRCVVSGQMVEHQGMLAPDVWADLDFITEPFCNVCGFPFDFEVETESQCAACLEDRPPYESARAALKYGESSRGIILGFKHADKTHAVRAFVPWLKNAGAGILEEADILTPVPLHFWRLVARRYNQAALMAYA